MGLDRQPWMRWVSRRGARARTVLLSLLLAVALAVGTLVWARSPVTVRVLMPAPFADATAATVADFNRRHRDMHIAVTRGPF